MLSNKTMLLVCLLGIGGCFVAAVVLAGGYFIQGELTLGGAIGVLTATLMEGSLLLFASMRLRRHRQSQTLGKRSFWIDALVPMAIQDDVQMNLTECMSKWVETHGRFRAGWIRRLQVLIIIGGHYGSVVGAGLGKVLKIIAGR